MESQKKNNIKVNNKIKTETKQEDKIIKEKVSCTVVLSTPTYYIINKNGINIIIDGINNKAKGDIVKY